ncbi:MAG: hypothetical protein KDE31_17325 [Caldilineaceae bacterium]|nr:hypothetical protein [Caldilineaceae bacterium]MCB0186036.1 hypothetical protein [Caldilineaceae bacterium]
MDRFQDDALANRFHAKLMATYLEAKRSCRYNATYLLQMMNELGGVATAKRLLASDNPAAGLTTLWECGRLDLSVEALVLLPEFATLFTEEEWAVPRRGCRLLTIRCNLMISTLLNPVLS